jgi:hypothetical protein
MVSHSMVHLRRHGMWLTMPTAAIKSCRLRQSDRSGRRAAYVFLGRPAVLLLVTRFGDIVRPPNGPSYKAGH